MVITGLTRNQLSGSSQTKGSNPLLSAKLKGTNPQGKVPFNIYFYQGFEQGGLPQGKFRPFGERLKSPWACRRRWSRANPLLSAKINTTVDTMLSAVTLGFYVCDQMHFG